MNILMYLDLRGNLYLLCATQVPFYDIQQYPVVLQHCLQSGAGEA